MAGIAIYAATIARKGLSTWNRQLRGSAEYDLARRILMCTYRLREAIAVVRHPGIFRSEQPPPPDEVAANMNELQKRHYGIVKAYEDRLQKLTIVRDELDAELLEAEALLGNDLLMAFEGIFGLQTILQTTVFYYLSACNPAESPASRRIYQESYEKRGGVLYRTFSPDEPDEFRDQVHAEIRRVESILKSHLLRS